MSRRQNCADFDVGQFARRLVGKLSGMFIVCLDNSLHCMQGHNMREDAFADT